MYIMSRYFLNGKIYSVVTSSKKVKKLGAFDPNQSLTQGHITMQLPDMDRLVTITTF